MQQYRETHTSDSDGGSVSGRVSPVLPEAPAIPDLQYLSGLENTLSRLSMNSEQGAGGGVPVDGGAPGGLSPAQFTQLVSDLATSTRNAAAQAQSNSTILEGLIKGLNQASPGSGGPNFNQKTFKDLVLEGSDEEKLDALISWENSVRRICCARNWPDPPRVSLENILNCVMAAFNGRTERLTQGVSPAECRSLDDFFTKIQKVCLGSAIGAKAYGMFQKRDQQKGEDINAYHSSLKVLFNMAFTTEARRKESQDSLKNKFLSGLRDFKLVEKLIETKDCTTLSYNDIRDELLTLMGRADIKRNLILLRRGGFPDSPRPTPWVPSSPPVQTPVEQPVEPMDWAPVAYVASGPGQRRGGAGSAGLIRSTPQWTRQPQGSNSAAQWTSSRQGSGTPARQGQGRVNQPVQLRPLQPSQARSRRIPTQPTEERICYNCRNPGHLARFCDQPPRPRRPPAPVQFVDADGNVYVRTTSASFRQTQPLSVPPQQPVQTVVTADASVGDFDLSPVETPGNFAAPTVGADDAWEAEVATVEGTYPGEPPVPVGQDIGSKNAQPQ